MYILSPFKSIGGSFSVFYKSEINMDPIFMYVYVYNLLSKAGMTIRTNEGNRKTYLWTNILLFC